jgi:alpha-galactosidase
LLKLGPHATDEEVAMNMVNALSWRPYLSGQIWALDVEKLSLMSEGVRIYKDLLRQFIPKAEPFWPLGLAKHDDSWSAFGIRTNEKAFLSVWHFEGGPEEICIPIIDRRVSEIRCMYPLSLETSFHHNPDRSNFTVKIPSKSARIFELILRE